MIVTYFRSSSLGNWEYCQLQYFMTYVLGLETESGHKAEKGTITHKALEVLANITHTMQKDPNATYFDDEHIGRVHFDPKAVMEPYYLDREEITKINKTRVNKSTYKDGKACHLKEGHVRYGVDLVDPIIDQCYDYYAGRSVHSWKPVDLKDCRNWTWMAIDHSKRQFDPRNREIWAAEPHFDIEIDRDWANYNYVMNGEKISGKLAIKGTIDLVTKVDDGIYEIVDWKTGERRDWATGQVKTYDMLCKDTQLMLYYYAAKELIPDARTIILTIFFVRDGGPFTICFDEETIEKMEALLKDKFQTIRNCQNPKLLDIKHKDFRCNRLCHYFKNSFDGEDIPMCDAVHNSIKKNGMTKTIQKYANKDHSVHKYQAPGE